MSSMKFDAVFPDACRYLYNPSKRKCIFVLKGIMYFVLTKKLNVHRFTLNLHSLKIMIVESFPWNFTYWGAVVFEKWVKVIIFVSVLECKNVLTSYAMVLV